MVYGYEEVTEQDVLTECASVMGYLECVDELISDDVVTETTIMEGIDIKKIGSSIIQVIKKMIDKVIGLLQKLSGFIRGKIRKKNKSSNGTSPNVSQNGHKNIYKTADEKLSKYPFTGVYPGAIIYVVLDLSCLISGIIVNGNSLFDIMGFIVRKQEGKEVDDETSKIVSEILSDNGANVIKRIYDFSNDDILKDSIAGKISSAGDFQNAPSIIYDYQVSGDNIYNKKIMDWNEVQHLYLRYGSEVNRYSDKCEQIQKDLDQNVSMLKSYKETLTSISVETPEDLQLIKCAQNIIGTVTQCYVSLGAGIIPVMNKCDADLDNVKNYLENVTNNIPELKKILER